MCVCDWFPCHHCISLYLSLSLSPSLTRSVQDDLAKRTETVDWYSRTIVVWDAKLKEVQKLVVDALSNVTTQRDAVCAAAVSAAAAFELSRVAVSDLEAALAKMTGDQRPPPFLSLAEPAPSASASMPHVPEEEMSFVYSAVTDPGPTKLSEDSALSVRTYAKPMAVSREWLDEQIRAHAERMKRFAGSPELFRAAEQQR